MPLWWSRPELQHRNYCFGESSSCTWEKACCWYRGCYCFSLV